MNFASLELDVFWLSTSKYWVFVQALYNTYDSGELQKEATVSIMEIAQNKLFVSDFDRDIKKLLKISREKPDTKWKIFRKL